MPKNIICKKCGIGCDKPCTALNKLSEIYEEPRTEEKQQLIKDLREELNLTDYETADDIKSLGEKVIQAIPSLNIIPEYNIKIGYVRSWEAKLSKGKQVNADCRKVTGPYTAYLPFDFIITFYEKNILMLHELKHIGIGERGLRIENHDIEDFKYILTSYGLDWDEFNQDCPDILADSGKKSRKVINMR